MNPTRVTGGAPSGLSPARRTVGDLIAWPGAAVAVGLWLGVTAAVLEGLRDSTFSGATLGRDIADALQASVITAILPGSLIGFVFALMFASAGFGAFGLWQAARRAPSRTSCLWLPIVTIGCFCAPVIVGTLLVNAFSTLNGTEWGIALLGIAVSVGVAGAIACVRRPHAGSRGRT